MYVLHGLGGIGKTQLAAQYARDHQEHYSCIFWLNADNITSLTLSLSAHFSKLPSEEQKNSAPKDSNEMARRVIKWLERDENRKWLLIYDNLDRKCDSGGQENDSESYDLDAWLPARDHGTALITSRLREHVYRGDGQEIVAVEEEKGLQILARNIGVELAAEGKSSRDITRGIALYSVNIFDNSKESNLSTTNLILTT